MSRLSEVRIKNLRSFGQEQRISLSPQVTVLLAPNGTGKTTFFQALELGLTGGILSLADEGLRPAIRDGERLAAVELRFDDVKSRVEVSLEGNVQRVGSLAPILGEMGSSNLSYLLRLTHLLDQHSKHWLVSHQPKVAGGTLSALPIGRDAARAQSVLRRAKPAVTKGITERTALVNTASADREGWRVAVAARNAAAGELDRPLVPLPTVAKNVSALLPKDEPLVEARREAIGEAVARATAHHDSDRTSLEHSLATLRAWEPQVVEHAAALEVVARDQELVERAGASVASAEAAAGVAEEALQGAGAELQRRTGEHEALTQQANLLRRLRDARAQVEAAKAALVTAETTLQNEKEVEQQLSSRLRASITLDAEHAGAEARKASSSRQLVDLAEKRNALGALREHQATIAALRVQLATAETALSDAQGTLNGVVGERDRRAALEATARSALEALQAVGTAIQAAVEQIWRNLPKDTDLCPVCLEPHGSALLQKRMADARLRTNPALAQASEGLREASVPAADASKQVDRHSEIVRGIEAQRNEVALRLKEGERDERAAGLLPDFEGQDLIEVERALEKAEQGARAESDEVARILKALSPRPSAEDLAKLRVRAEQAVADLAGRQRAVSLAVSSLQETISVAESAEAEAGRIDDPEGVADRLVAADRRATEAARIRSELDGARAHVRQVLDRAATAHENAKREFGVSNRHREGLVARWKELELAGEPDETVLQAAREEMQVRVLELDAHSEALGRVREELGRRDLAVSAREKQAAVDRLRDGLSEEGRSAAFDSQVADVEQELARWQRAADALRDLSDNLQTELGHIRDLIGAVVPDWQALLRRMVQDARFAETQLRYFEFRKVDHAQTSVPLHGDRVAARHVASEAQLTELQLSFLLAMSRKHAWSPWRGLLLDDPTQHHDLVHAAAVFDVLRDYIVEYDFQVVMATHDALQARFFLRKLRNDGIHATFVHLVPSSSGVVVRSDR